MARGDYDEAAEAYQRAAEADPNSPGRWRVLARAQLMADRPPEARAAFARMAALLPNDPHPLVEIGFTHELERAYDRALQSYLRAVSVAPRSAYAHRVLGSRLLRWERAEESIEPLERALLLDPEHGETAKALALARHATGDVEGAKAAYRVGIEANPNDIGLRLGLAAVLINDGEFEGALAIYDALLQSVPSFAAAHVGRGILLHELGRTQEAEAAFVRATEVSEEPQYVERLEAYRALLRAPPQQQQPQMQQQPQVQQQTRLEPVEQETSPSSVAEPPADAEEAPEVGPASPPPTPPGPGQAPSTPGEPTVETDA